MRKLRLLSLLLPLALAPGCVVAGDAYPVQGHAYYGGYGYAPRPYYAPRPTYYAQPPVRYYAPPLRHYAPPARFYAPPPRWREPPRAHWDHGRGRGDWRRHESRRDWHDRRG